MAQARPPVHGSSAARCWRASCAIWRGWKWGGPKPVHWHEGLWRGWTRDSVFDLLAPLVVCLLAAWLVSRYLPPL